MMARANRQLGLRLHTWGGKREGAGRKPKGAKAGVPHRSRPALSSRHPVHVTLRVLPHVWNLRSRRAFRAIGRAFLGSRERDGFRLVHYSVQGNHLHLICEARDADRLSRGMQGLATWVARRLNKMMERHGKVFADRFHAHALRSPREVAYAVAYVLGNFALHLARRAAMTVRAEGRAAEAGPPARGGRCDPYSSSGPEGPALTAAARTWLLREGVRRADRGPGGGRTGVAPGGRVSEALCEVRTISG